MKRRNRIVVAIGSVVLAAIAAGGLRAQSAPQTKTFEKRVYAIGGAEGDGAVVAGHGVAMAAPGGDHTFEFISSEYADYTSGGNVVKGAPYSAEAITEMVQALADGNRITRENRALIFRDSDGRLRREQTLGAIGPWAPADEPPKMIFIHDPVAGVHYVLDPRQQTARKMSVPGSKGETSQLRWRQKTESGAAQHGGNEEDVLFINPGIAHDATAPVPPPIFQRKMEMASESLGTQVIEGVQAEGTRVTMTIAAGEIGNERPIQVVSESWYSPELQTVVLSKRSDPRFGETNYRLTNIQRVEPLRSLFEVPADYTLEEGGTFFRRRQERLIQTPVGPKDQPAK